MSSREQIEAEYAPRINAAYLRAVTSDAAENARRDSALVDAPVVVCGIPLRAMTLHDYLALIHAGNAYVTTPEVPADAVAELRFWAAHNFAVLWLLSPDFRPDPAARDAFMAAHAATLPLGDLVAGIKAYMRDTFADAPQSSLPPAGTTLPADPIGCSFAIHWQHAIARAYGWSRAEIRALPLKELFQILRRLEADRKLKDGESLRAPLKHEADRLWAEMLVKINALNN